MIIQNINSDHRMMGYPKAIVRALDYLGSHDLLSIDSGVYEIEGKDMFVQVFDYTSRDFSECKPEFHKEYLDIQYWPGDVDERLGFAINDGNLAIVEPHSERDLYFTTEPDDENIIKVGKGDYVVFFPSDIHRPGILVDEKKTYRKVVLKLRTSLLLN